MKARARELIMAGLFNLMLSTMLYAAPGDLDASFGGTGRARLGFGFGQDFGRAVAVQADGKLIVAGSCGLTDFAGPNLALVRLGTNNLLDPSFGNAGKVITPMVSSPNGSAQIEAVQIQRDGRIIAAGTAYNGSGSYAFLARYKSDGSLDESFGGSGIITNNFGQYGRGHALAIQADDKILLAGLAGTSVNSSFGVARYTTNGTLDLSFGGTGVVTDLAGGDAEVSGMTLQADGKIVVAGSGGFDFAVLRYTTNGVLDPTFGGTGRVFTHVRGSDEYSIATSVTVQPGDNVQTLDKIVVAGHTHSFATPFVFEVARYNLNGTPDPSFGNAGVVLTPIGSDYSFAQAVVVQGTGVGPRKIIVAGYSYNGSDHDFSILRYNDNGTPDFSFHGDGKIITSFGSGNDEAYGMIFVGSGKVIVAGSSVMNEGNSDFALARYNLSDGSYDTSFDGDGKLTVDIAERTSMAKGVAVGSDGKVVAAGSAFNGLNNSFILARFSSDGAVDPAFGTFGKVSIPFGTADSGANAISIQSDGKIVAAGFRAGDFAVVRLHPNGVLDSSFGGTGFVTTSFSTNDDAANAIAVQSDGKIVVAGTSYNGANVDFAVARYNSNGTPDDSFGTSGRVTTAIDTSVDVANAVAIQPDGKIVVAGYAVIGGTAVDFAVARYRTNGTLDPSFGSFGRVATALGAGGAVGSALAIQPDGKILVAGYTLPTLAGAAADFGLARYTTNGVPDASFDGDGKVTTSIGLGNDFAVALALQSDGKIVVGGSSTIGAHLEFTAVRYTKDGWLDDLYGVGGRAITEFGDNADNTAYALTLDSLGRAVIAGDAGGLFGVARLQGDPHLQILSISRLPNGHVALRGIGVPNQVHAIRGATNLIPPNFNTLGHPSADAAGVWQYDDAGAVNSPRRFYQLTFP